MKNNEGSESFVLDNDSKKKDKVIGKISLVTGVLRMFLTTVDLRQGTSRGQVFGFSAYVQTSLQNQIKDRIGSNQVTYELENPGVFRSRVITKFNEK